MKRLENIDNLPEPELRLRALVAGIEHVHRPNIISGQRSMPAECAVCRCDWPCQTMSLIGTYRHRVSSDTDAEAAPPVVIELAPDEVRDLAADFALAASRRERVRVMVDPDEGLKVSPGGHRWSVGFGSVWS